MLEVDLLQLAARIIDSFRPHWQPMHHLYEIVDDKNLLKIQHLALPTNLGFSLMSKSARNALHIICSWITFSKRQPNNYITLNGSMDISIIKPCQYQLHPKPNNYVEQTLQSECRDHVNMCWSPDTYPTRMGHFKSVSAFKISQTSMSKSCQCLGGFK